MAGHTDSAAVLSSRPTQSIREYTWPGIEYGEPPSCRFSFFQYVDALRLGDLERFIHMEAETWAWWNIHMDRGAGAALHFAVDGGQMRCVKFLVERRGAQVNQRDRGKGWTPLHRAARLAHHTHAPHLAVFEYLLQHGADPSLTLSPATQQAGSLPVDLAVHQGRGWQPGQVKQVLQKLVDSYSSIPKTPSYVYSGGNIGTEAQMVLDAWQALPKAYPPQAWRPPPPAGFADAQSMRLCSQEPWRTAGTHDGSSFIRAATDEELKAQST